MKFMSRKTTTNSQGESAPEKTVVTEGKHLTPKEREAINGDAEPSMEQKQTLIEALHKLR